MTAAVLSARQQKQEQGSHTISNNWQSDANNTTEPAIENSSSSDLPSTNFPQEALDKKRPALESLQCLSESEQQAVRVLQGLLPTTDTETVRSQFVRTFVEQNGLSNLLAESQSQLSSAPSVSSMPITLNPSNILGNLDATRPHKIPRIASAGFAAALAAAASFSSQATPESNVVENGNNNGLTGSKMQAALKKNRDDECGENEERLSRSSSQSPASSPSPNVRNQRTQRGHSTAWRRKSKCHYCEPLGQNCGLVAGKCPNRPCNRCNQRHRLGRCRRNPNKQTKRRTPQQQNNEPMSDESKDSISRSESSKSLPGPVPTDTPVLRHFQNAMNLAGNSSIVKGKKVKTKVETQPSSPVPSMITDRHSSDSDVDISRPPSPNQQVYTLVPHQLRPPALDTTENTLAIMQAFQPTIASIRQKLGLPQSSIQTSDVSNSSFSVITNEQEKRPGFCLPLSHALETPPGGNTITNQQGSPDLNATASSSLPPLGLWASQVMSLRTPTSLAVQPSNVAAAGGISPKSSRSARRAVRGNSSPQKPSSKATSSPSSLPSSPKPKQANQQQQRQYTMMRKRSECHFCKQIGQNCGRVAGKCPNRPCSDCGGRHRHGRCRLKRIARVFANDQA